MIKRKRTPQGERIIIEGVEAHATRAVYQEARGHLPKIEFKVKDDAGNSFEFTMYLQDAVKFIQESLHAIDAATPDTPRPAYRTPFG